MPSNIFFLMPSNILQLQHGPLILGRANFASWAIMLTMQYGKPCRARTATDIDTEAGTARPTAIVDAIVPHIGRRSAMVMPLSRINMASMGETCTDMGCHVYWPASSEQPHFWRDGDSNEVPLTMVNCVPFLLSAVECGADLLPQGTSHDMDEFFAGMFRKFSMTLHGSELAEIAAPLAMVVQRQPSQQHCLAHYPKDPNCEVCLQAKMCRESRLLKSMQNASVVIW